MGRDIRADIRSPGHGGREFHGQQGIGITAEYLPVKEIAPAADDLPQDQPVSAGIQQQTYIDLFDLTVDGHRGNAANDTAVNSQSAAPQIKDLQQVILIHIPHKDDIIDPGADYGQDQQVDPDVPDRVWIQTCLFGHMGGQQKAGQHGQGYHDPVHGDRKTADHNVLGDIFQINSQMRKSDIHLFHKGPSSCNPLRSC